MSDYDPDCGLPEQLDSTEEHLQRAIAELNRAWRSLPVESRVRRSAIEGFETLVTFFWKMHYENTTEPASRANNGATT